MVFNVYSSEVVKDIFFEGLAVELYHAGLGHHEDQESVPKTVVLKWRQLIRPIGLKSTKKKSRKKCLSIMIVMMREFHMRKRIFDCKFLHLKGGMILKLISDGKESWEMMKKIRRNQFLALSYHMKNRVVPLSYHNEFFKKFCKLQQGSQSVMESFEALMEQYLFGLCEELADKVQCYHYATMEDLNIINRHKKRISSMSIYNSSSKLEMEEFVEYAVDGDVSLEDLKVFVNSLVNYGGINMDEKEERELITQFGQDGKSMVEKIELAHMRDIATIQWVEKIHQTMRKEELLIQDSRMNLYEEAEDDTWSGGHFRHFRVKRQNANLVTFKDLNIRRIIPCRSWTLSRPRVCLKNSGAEMATTHKAHWAKSGQEETQ
ncbi:hypothetical protein Ahy_B08g091629 [Arachis hypogaea]|uniref:Uncharacterized protein n=1 Tax=Arachis hypogaea TaxID=3818 RepID=A0A444Y2E7_ARAHY|nr:hypothetical protein Ahy_B08g091629 [Arachis hypogaea]